MKTTLLTVQSYLENMQNRGLLKDTSLLCMSGGAHKLYVLSKKIDHGYEQTDLMTIDEIYGYLKGYDKAICQ